MAAWARGSWCRPGGLGGLTGRGVSPYPGCGAAHLGCGGSRGGSAGHGDPELFMRVWQRLACEAVAVDEQAGLMNQLDPAAQALLHSQAGPLAGRVLTVIPTCPELHLTSETFRVVLLRRLRLPLPVTARRCRCGATLDVLGDHRAAQWSSGPAGVPSRGCCSTHLP